MDAGHDSLSGPVQFWDWSERSQAHPVVDSSRSISAQTSGAWPLPAEAVATLQAIAARTRTLSDARLGGVAVIDGQWLRFIGLGEMDAGATPKARSLIDRALRKRDLVWIQDALREASLAKDPLVV